jgi:hypothetical protein
MTNRQSSPRDEAAPSVRAEGLQGSGGSDPPERGPSADHAAAAAPRPDLDVRLKGRGLMIPRGRIAAVLAALAAAGWAVMPSR